MRWAEKQFHELISILEANPAYTASRLRAMVESQNLSEVRNGVALSVAQLYREGKLTEGLELLERMHTRFELLPVPLFILKVSLLTVMKREHGLVEAYFDFGLTAVQKGAYEVGIESLSIAYVHDAMGGMTLLHDPNAIRIGAQAYESVVEKLNLSVGPVRPPQSSAKLRVGMLVPNLVDASVAYSNRVIFFSRYIDRKKVELSVYCTENSCFRTHQLPRAFASHPSPNRAPHYLRELAERGDRVYMAPRHLPILETAQQVAREIVSDGIDLLILQSGPAMPIDWFACRWAEVPTKLQLHIGVPAYQSGIDLTLFDNKVNLQREASTWPDYAGGIRLMRRGTDLSRLEQQVPISRRSLGLPDDAVVLGVLSNHLEVRASDAYLGLIHKLLQNHANLWFLAIGTRERDRRLRTFFSERGGLDRVRLIPPQRAVGSYLKALDIYANEFPAGGSQAVVEAMACGLPVAALCAGRTHHESVGADIVGSRYAIPLYDTEAYGQLIEDWIVNPEMRQAAALYSRQRAYEQFSIKRYVQDVCELGAELCACRTRRGKTHSEALRG